MEAGGTATLCEPQSPSLPLSAAWVMDDAALVAAKVISLGQGAD